MPAVSLSELFHQPDASAFLRGVAARGRPANAYLFFGPPGVGKCTAALAFARALLCERNGGGPPAAPSLFDAGGEKSASGKGRAKAGAPAGAAAPGDPCGVCPACHKAARLEHPDLRFLFPVSGEERELEETVAETIASWREDPLYVFSYPRAASIRLKMTRELLRELSYKPFEAGWRVVVVRDADAMREDQYSAMLKAIEEPGAVTVWILTTSRPNRLPATIRSRCQRVRFAPLGEEAIAHFMCEHVGLSRANAVTLAGLSSGSLSRAIEMRDEDPAKLRNQALALLAPAWKQDYAALWTAIQKFNSYGRAGRETLRRTIGFQALWLRDVLRARYGAGKEMLVNDDIEAQIRRHAQQADATEIRRRLMVLEEALRAIEGNVSPELSLFSALRRVAHPGASAAVWPPHPTARWDY